MMYENYKSLNEYQIIAYITEYLDGNKDKKFFSSDPNVYLKHINTIPGLSILIKNQFFLMITIEIMPNIIKKYYEETYRFISKTLLLDQYIESIFEKEEERLLLEDKIFTDGRDIKLDFWAFAMELAEAMYEEDTFEVTYNVTEVAVSNEQIFTNKWEKFFGIPLNLNEDDARNLDVARKGCSKILKVSDGNRYAFTNELLRDYFIVKKLKIEIGSKEDEQVLARLDGNAKHEQNELIFFGGRGNIDKANEDIGFNIHARNTPASSTYRCTIL